MKTKLKPFQKKGVRKITHFGGRALLADEMGLGKTLQTLKWLEENPEIRPAVVVCPASLKWVWQHEARLHLKMRSEILEGTKPPFFNPITLDHPGIESKFTGWFLWKYRIEGIAYYAMNLGNCQ